MSSASACTGGAALDAAASMHSDALRAMLRDMQPELHPQPYSITVQSAPVAGAFATVAEAEGLTVIAPLTVVPCDAAWARISFTLHTDLAG